MHAESDAAGLEQRLSNLQSQIDGLRHTGSDDTRLLEQRLPSLAEDSAAILRRWAAIADRHVRAVTQLEAHLRELGDAGNRLQQDATERLQNLERIIEQEWSALREIHEAPVRQLVEQAASLTEVCIATANSAQHGFDRAEARLATLEADFHRATSELTREVHAVLAEVRQLSAMGPRQLATTAAPAWPLEDVTRLHQQLREAGDTVRALPAAAAPPPPATPAATEPRPIEVARPAPAPPIETGPEAPRRRSLVRAAAIIAIAALLAASAVLTWRFQRDVRVATDRAERAQVESRMAAEAASRDAAAREEVAASQLAAARDLASRTQTIGDVLAAPDLVRYALAGTESMPAASGQVLWSRSRGFVFSASGLPPPPSNATYQIWLLTRAGAVSAATFLPDDAGRVTVTAPVNVPRPVVGAIVTTERKEGATTPSGQPLLARLPPPPPVS